MKNLLTNKSIMTPKNSPYFMLILCLFCAKELLLATSPFTIILFIFPVIYIISKIINFFLLPILKGLRRIIYSEEAHNLYLWKYKLYFIHTCKSEQKKNNNLYFQRYKLTIIYTSKGIN